MALTKHVKVDFGLSIGPVIMVKSSYPGFFLKILKNWGVFRGDTLTYLEIIVDLNPYVF